MRRRIRSDNDRGRRKPRSTRSDRRFRRSIARASEAKARSIASGIPESVMGALVRAYSRIEDPSNWCQGMESLDDMKWCLVGAFTREICDLRKDNVLPSRVVTDMYWSGLSRLVMSLDSKFESLPAFNDAPNTTHSDVLELYDRAISVSNS